MNDLQFVQRCTRGSKEAWGEFVEKYSRLIYNYIHSVLKASTVSVGQENIDDLLHEVFLSLIKDNFKKLKSFKAKNKCSLASWLRQVTINHTIDYVRTVRKTISLDEEDDRGLSIKEILSDGSTSIAEALMDREKLAELKECIGRLDKDEKYFLELHINRDIALDELKGHFRISRAAVDMRKFRIVRKLRECFRGKKIWLDF